MPIARHKGNTVICSNRNCEKTLGIVKNGVLEIKCRCGQFNDVQWLYPDCMSYQEHRTKGNKEAVKKT